MRHFSENVTENGYSKKKVWKNFFGSGVFGMGRSIYLKHEYFFSRPLLKWYKSLLATYLTRKYYGLKGHWTVSGRSLETWRLYGDPAPLARNSIIPITDIFSVLTVTFTAILHGQPIFKKCQHRTHILVNRYAIPQKNTESCPSYDVYMCHDVVAVLTSPNKKILPNLAAKGLFVLDWTIHSSYHQQQLVQHFY